LWGNKLNGVVPGHAVFYALRIATKERKAHKKKGFELFHSGLFSRDGVFISRLSAFVFFAFSRGQLRVSALVECFGGFGVQGSERL
jgi:hypothetical protein